MQAYEIHSIILCYVELLHFLCWIVDSLPVCAGCGEKITDKFVLKVLDMCWHSQCLRCVDCQLPLTDKCFSKDDLVYCRDDFFRFQFVLIMSICIVLPFFLILHAYLCIHALIDTDVNTIMHIHIHTNKHTLIYIHTYTYTHIHIYSHTHIHKWIYNV